MKDLTPEHMRCPWGQCPSVRELEDGRLLIVGARADQRALDAGIGMSPTEQAILIDRSYFADFIRERIAREG